MAVTEHYLSDEVDPLFIRGARDKLLDFMPPGPAINVGIGYGVWDEWLADQDRPGCTSIDLDPGLVRHFRARFPTINYVCADATAWLPEDRVAAVVASHLLEHLDDPVAALRFWRENWLTPDGIVLAVVPNADSLHRWIGQGMGIIRERTDLDTGDHKLGHKRVYTRALLEEHVEEAGFRCDLIATVTMKALTNTQLASMPRSYVQACIDMPLAACGDAGGQIIAVLAQNGRS